MNETRRESYRDRIIDEAAEWFARLHEGEPPAEDRVAFADWLAASPEHVREYLELAALHADISESPAPSDLDALVKAAQHASDENVVRHPAVVPAVQANIGRPRRRSFGARLALAASLASAALLTAAWWLHAGSSDSALVTGRGEQKSLALPDGSVMALNAVSKITVEFTDRYRDIHLVAGEALFEVAKDARRPFRVLVGESVIQAVGTRFNVRHRNADTTVTVVEGKVAVSSQAERMPVLLAVGQQLTINTGAASAPAPTDVSAATAWRERRLVFDSRPLGEVVAEFNLYNDLPMTLRDSKLVALKVSGAFYANDPRSFALFLEEAQLAVSHTDAQGIALSAPATH